MRRTAGVHVLNLGTGQAVTVMRLLKALVGTNSIEIPYEIISRRKGDTDHVMLMFPKQQKNLVGKLNEISLECAETLGDLRRIIWNRDWIYINRLCQHQRPLY
ncbi:MAG: hypothetical protein COA82_09765 [Alkaliphilus sp.]|nr:MAG: hypothetical protein COA82_09765 [Alkaliphilus sp.]